MSAILVVTGARCLDDTISAQEWTKDVLRDALECRPWRGVMHGGAVGPDAWAGFLARLRNVSEAVYGLDGTVRQDGKWLRSWSEAPRPHPLDRNRALIAAAARLAGMFDVYVLGLLAPWSKTAGTAFTLTHARDAGLPTWVASCPEELGPLPEVRR